MKKYRRSRITVCCYVLAALFAVYFLTVMAGTVKTVNDYFAAYNMYPGAGEILSYAIQSGMTPLLSAVLLLMAGVIHDEVRRLNPSYYASDEELADAKDAKRAERDKKAAEKAEAKAVLTDEWEEKAEGESVPADFSAVTVPETPEEAKAEEGGTDDQVEGSQAD